MRLPKVFCTTKEARGFSIDVRESTDNPNSASTVELDIYMRLADDDSEFDVISIISHGVLDVSGDPAILLGVIASTNRFLKYFDMVIRGEIGFVRYAISGNEESFFTITQKFVENRMPVSSGALVYLGVCYGLGNEALADAFQANGAAAILGFTGLAIPEAVGTEFAYQHGLAAFNQLATGVKTGQIVGLGNVYPNNQSVRFKLHGAENLVL